VLINRQKKLPAFVPIVPLDKVPVTQVITAITKIWCDPTRPVGPPRSRVNDAWRRGAGHA
jgi:hypothetical protein